MGLDAITKSSSVVFTECSGLEMHETSPTYGRLASYYYDCGDGNYWGVWISSSTGYQTTWLKKFYKPNSGGSSTFASCFKCDPPIPPKERGQTWRVEVTVRKSGMILPAGI
jgi:hypothetical protein